MEGGDGGWGRYPVSSEKKILIHFSRLESAGRYTRTPVPSLVGSEGRAVTA